MSGYGLTLSSDAQQYHHHGVYDKVQHSYSPGGLTVVNKANFSVSHLLDLEELPRENCNMYANTDLATSPHGQTNGHHTSPHHTPHSNNNSAMCGNNTNNTPNNSNPACVHGGNNTNNNNTSKNNNSITDHEDKRSGMSCVRKLGSKSKKTYTS